MSYIDDAIRYVMAEEDLAFEDCETCKGRFTCHLRSYCLQEEHE